jgi:hypothetical protein
MRDWQSELPMETSSPLPILASTTKALVSAIEVVSGGKLLFPIILYAKELDCF